jgi:predicted O-methyltransferase YrrM
MTLLSGGSPSGGQADPTWAAVDAWFDAHLHFDDPVLQAAQAAADEAGLPPISVAANQGRLLMLWARAMGARRILEIGTLAGYSTIWLARALPADGDAQVTTIEYKPEHAEVARANLARAGLGERVSVRVGAALDVLPQLAQEERGPFDFIFIDADKENNAAYFAWALRLSRPGSVIVVDNVVRAGAVLDADGDSRVQGVRALLAYLAQEPRVTVTAVQTVGAKGYDGLIVALVA